MNVYIPSEIIEEARRKGIDIELVIIRTLAKVLGLDPRREAEIHLKIAEKFFDEGLYFIEKGDSIQASEKLYKAVEECIKAAAIAMELREVLDAVEARGRWTVTDLERVVRKLDKMFKGAREWWDSANYLHMWGFHEAKLDIDAVKERVNSVKSMLQVVKKLLNEIKPSEYSK